MTRRPGLVVLASLTLCACTGGEPGGGAGGSTAATSTTTGAGGGAGGADAGGAGGHATGAGGASGTGGAKGTGGATGAGGATGSGGAPGGGGAGGSGGTTGAGGGAGGAPPDSAIPGLDSAWAIHDGEKIERDDLAHPAKQGNVAWDGTTVKLVAARNEIVAFQVVAEAGAAGVHALGVSLERLDRRGGGGSIVYAPPAADPTAYAGRPIQVFVENYMNVAEPTKAGWIYTPGGPAAPADPTGWKPVQLVPENAKVGRGGLPVDVAPKQGQAFWFDVYVAASVAPGIYDGAVRLRAGGGQKSVPVELEVLDVTLPDEPSMTAMIYFEPEQVEQYHGHGLEAAYHRLAHRSRIELAYAYDAASAKAAKGRFDGSDFTAAAGYEGPGAGVGNRMAPASFYSPGPGWETKSTAWQKADAWMSFLASELPHATTFLYMPDEPGPSQFGLIQTIASNVHGDPGPGRALPIFVTHAYTADLDGSIDIWCAAAQAYDPSRAAKERAKGRRYWFYNGRRPETGAQLIDTPAVDMRINPWAAFEDGVDVYFYWHSVHWRHNSQKVGDRDQNVWLDPVTFDNRGQPNKPASSQGFANGDGVLLYPGEEVVHPDQDRGVPGPVASIQLLELRRGLQDHALLTLAKSKGLGAEVDAALAAVVPKVFTEAGSAVGFAQQGDVVEAARRAVARAIAAAK
jgi:hypothetical protein